MKRTSRRSVYQGLANRSNHAFVSEVLVNGGQWRLMEASLRAAENISVEKAIAKLTVRIELIA